MESIFKDCLPTRHKSDVEKQKRHYTVEDYDRTYEVPMSVMKLCGLRLNFEGSSMVKFWKDVLYWFSFMNLFVVTWLELISMVQTAKGGSFEDAVDIFRMMPCVGYVILAWVKSYKIACYRPVYENLVNELRAMWPVGSVSEEEDNVIKKALTQLKYVVKGYYWCNNILALIFLSASFVEILKRALSSDEPLMLPFFYWLPFDPYKRGPAYVIVLLFQSWHTLITIWFILCGDLLFCIFISHITTMFDLLAIRIKKLIYIPLDQQMIEAYPLGNYSKQHVLNNQQGSSRYEEWEQKYQKELSEIISRHLSLIRLSSDVEDMYSLSLLLNFFNSSIILCFCGFCCVIVEKWNEIVYKSFLTTALSQTWLLCWYGQRLLDASTGVSDALYNSGWYKASKETRSSLFIMLHRAQKAARVTTYGFSVVCLASYTMIIKSAWSYFTLLLKIYRK